MSHEPARTIIQVMIRHLDGQLALLHAIHKHRTAEDLRRLPAGDRALLGDDRLRGAQSIGDALPGPGALG